MGRRIRLVLDFNRRTLVTLKRLFILRLIGVFGLLLSSRPAAVSDVPAPGVDAPGIEFFEKKIRPLLADKCYQCHSAEAEKVKGGLVLDTKESLLKGGDTGPALVAGDPEKSLLIKAVRYTDENLQMPPKGKKLSPEQIADLVAWVKMGAPDPRSGQAPIAKFESSSSRHWAFQPIRQPPFPAVKNARWVSTGMDRFILARLEAQNLEPSAPADKRTLMRRASFDLTGLPPTPEEVDDFLGDHSAEAFVRVVDRLLASRYYGERWGRYWLDVARYADTKGYVFEEERRYPYSYTYRDYVIRALNEDLPFDQFVIQQLAADLLPLGEDKRPLAALGFLTLGRRFLNNEPDIIDDRIDVVTRGTMGLTVSCARCHDHKFDPIPTKDYYSLYGVFASCSEQADKPLLGSAALSPSYPDYLAQKKQREEELRSYRTGQEGEVLTRVRSEVGDYLLAVHDARKLEDRGRKESLVRERKLDPALAQRWQERLEARNQTNDAVFAPWFQFSHLGETNFSDRAKAATEEIGGQSGKALNPAVVKLFSAQPSPATLKEVAARYNQLFAGVNKEWMEAVAKTDLPVADRGLNSRTNGFAEIAKEALRQIIYGPDSPVVSLSEGEISRLFPTPVSQRLRALQRKVDELDATHPGAPPRAMVLVDNPTPHNPRVFVRGNPNNPGPEVPRQFLELVEGPRRQPFTQGSGRLELARSIVSPSNPLTARVIANRIWMHHFVTPLVRTPSDFGVRSDPPSHPELLDYLAASLMEEGWSLKKLHRLMMLSSTYQQSSEDQPLSAQADPGNQLFWKMNRRRLDFEGLRDTLLSVSGRLNLATGGRAEDITIEPFSTRRTVYGFIERQNLPGLFRTFDFASPDTTSPQRFSTTVPQQALFLMNSPFVVQQAKSLLERPEVKAMGSEAEKLRKMFQIAYQRWPDPDEIKLIQQFIEHQEASSRGPETGKASAPGGASGAQLDAKGPAKEKSKALSAWEKYAQVLLLSNELVFLD